MRLLTFLIIVSTVAFSQQGPTKPTPKKQDEKVKPATAPNAAGNTKQVQADADEVHQAAIKFFFGVPESVIREVHTVFSNEKSTADEMEAALKKLTVFFVPLEMREKFQDIISQLQSLISLKMKLFNEVSDKAKEAIKEIDRSKMDEMLAFVKLDKETRKEVIDYYMKVKKAQNELLAKVHSMHAHPSKGKVQNVLKKSESEKKPHKRIGLGILQKTIEKIVQKRKEKVNEAKKAEVKAEKVNEAKKAEMKAEKVNEAKKAEMKAEKVNEKEQQKKMKSNEKEEKEDSNEHE